MKKWKQYSGSKATFNNLIIAFEQAGHKDYAETVQKIAGEVCIKIIMVFTWTVHTMSKSTVYIHVPPFCFSNSSTTHG